jgi:lipopolysaccharide transport system ATP-binding protein
MDPILEVINLSKKYRIRHQAGGYLSLRERLLGVLSMNSTTVEEFWALNDISFNVMPGESVGIIGRNGAGKSTILKILSKITPPTKGKIVSRGRIASLLEVGTGFHPELTGRENIFFNGSLLGMQRREIQSKFDEIVDFSQVEKFLDTPLKHYSSGMQLRLAFSVAAFLEPEILIIDEVLAVGDAEFQKKCIGKMEDVSKGGRTILFVSHNMAAVETLCKKAVLLDKGSMVTFDEVDSVVKKYQQQMQHHASSSWRREAVDERDTYFENISIALSGDQPHCTLTVRANVVSKSVHTKAFIALDFSNSLGFTFMQAIPELSPFINHSPAGRDITIEVNLPPLIPDTYYVTAWLGAHNLQTFDELREVVSFDITQSPTPGRTFPHTTDHGVIVPFSRVIR